jgi:uncharacterized protein YndB with AHSA1/START domain
VTALSDTTTVTTSIEVDVPVERAFEVFTTRFDEVKPRDHNLLATPIVETVLEPWVGGRVFDRAEDGSTCQWGRVLAVDPPNRLLVSWDIGPSWQLEDDPARCSEWEVRFVGVTDERTRVTIEHRHIDRHGDGWEATRGAVESEGGWPLYLSRFAAAAGS